ncbi:MAG TPA: membrane dipeptidase [Myxococcota bacterium]|nr:membrane dipeptidase [Myxococcota bacterium]
MWDAVAVNGERYLNRIESAPLPEVSAAALALHEASFVADLHADSLLFGRDLARRSEIGHVDLPRLHQGNVALQVFAAATSVPAGINIDHNPRDAFDVLYLVYCARLSRGCWGGKFARVETLAGRLARLVEREPDLAWVRTAADLEALRARRAGDPRALGAILSIEGAQALEGNPQNLERAFALGVRMIGLAHFTDNDYAGSAHGAEKGGLTELGRRTLARMEELGVAVDVAHLAPAAIDGVLAIAHKPVVVSHGGLKGTCDNARTISDAHARAIAATGGVIGIGYWREAVCGIAPNDIARAVRYAVELVGDEHVALGSDYDGAVPVAFDTSHLAVVTQAMLDAGISRESIPKILGGNAVRVLAETLPGS